MGWMHEVILENFKSYEGRIRVGPFRKFTCIVGPNGAGKSNLMDAISFVLGVPARHLRGERLQDLVHRKEGEPPQPGRPASVQLVYMSDPPGDGGPGSSTGVTTVFQRVVQPTSQARFRIDDVGVSEAEYVQRLESIKILSKARNFLVFQGDVEAAASRRGRDLTALFEQVSGSIAFREEYEQLAAEKAQKEDAARALYVRRRSTINERKRLVRQSDEAEKYRRLEAERQRLEVEFYLFRLHCIAKQREEAARRNEQELQQRDGLREQVAEKGRSLEELEETRRRLHEATLSADAKVNLAKHDFGKVNPALIRVRSQIHMEEQRMAELASQAEASERRAEQLTSQAKALEEEEGRLQGELERLAKVEQQAQAPLFSPEQQEEFQQAQRAAQQMTSESSQQAQDLEAQIRTIARERARLEMQQQEGGAQCAHVQRRLQDLAEVAGQAREAHGRDQEAAGRLKERLEKSHVDEQQIEQQKEALMAKRSSLLQEIQNITATERQIEYERRLTQITADLTRLVPGVHGRVVDLYKESQRRMRVAVGVALGGMVDGVVTESAEGGRQCVRYLKERMLEPMTFLPLDSIRAPPPNRTLEDAVRGHNGLFYALHCISFSEQFRRVFDFLLGDVVFAVNMDEGRRFVFGELRNLGIACRLVTLDGETISRDGNMAVNSQAIRGGATRVDLKTLEASKTQLECIDRQLSEFHSREAAANQATMQEEVQRLQARAKESSLGLERCQQEIQAREQELQAREAEVREAQPELQRLTEEEAKLREEQRHLEASISQATSNLFARLGAEMGVEDIRKREREWRQAHEDAQRQQAAAQQQLGITRAEMQMVQQSLREQGRRGVGESIARSKGDLERLKAEEAQRAQEEDVSHSQLGTSEADRNEALEAERVHEKLVLAARRELQAAQQSLAEVERNLKAIGAELQALRDAQADLLRRSVLEDVDVPLLAGAEQQALEDIAGSVGPEVAGREAAEQGGVATDLELAVDLAALPEEKRAVTGGPAAKMLEGEYQAELKRLAKELEQLRPNLKATEQLPELEERAEGVAQEAAAAHREAEDVESRFEAVRKARRERFMLCFRKIQEEIGAVYKRLTAVAGGTDGGTAYLDIEDLEEPYNGGVKFTAMPPTKRFSDIGLLSGGEKSLAAMALIFAMQAYQQPPFLVLDEVDASLDAGNVQALARYMERSECQTIVISLKDAFFSHSDGLVGVSKDKAAGASVLLTLDLARIRQAHAASQKARADAAAAAARESRSPTFPPIALAPLGQEGVPMEVG